MFIRVSILKNRKYMQIFHSYWDGQKNKPRMIAKLGQYDEARYGQVKTLLKDWVRMDRAPAIIAEIKASPKNNRY